VEPLLWQVGKASRLCRLGGSTTSQEVWAALQVVLPARGYVSAPSSPRAHLEALTSNSSAGPAPTGAAPSCRGGRQALSCSDRVSRLQVQLLNARVVARKAAV